MIRLNPKSLRSRIALAATMFAAIVCLLGLATYGSVHEEIERHLNNRIKAEANALIASAGTQGVVGLVAAVQARELQRHPGDLGYIVVDAAGRRVAGSLNARIPVPGYTEFVHYRLEGGRHGVAQAFNLPIPNGGRLVVAADRRDVDKMDEVIFSLFGATLAIIALAGIALATILQRSVERRLATISRSAEAIISGDLAQRMPLVGDAEFDRIGTVINMMLDRIELLMNSLRQISTDLAHDIRSPLNRVRGRLEPLADTDGEEGPLATAAIGEIDSLLELLGGLMGISEIEGFAVRKRFRPLFLKPLVVDILDGFGPALDAAGLQLEFEGAEAIVMGDEALLRRCLANILDNAILHGSGATCIGVRMKTGGNSVTIVISDDGPGVPAGSLEAIFDRFTRLERSRSAPGHGLGLNIVSAIMRAHRGTAIARAGQKGLVMELSLPIVVL